MQLISFKRHRFPPSVIVHAVWLYARFTLSFRDVEEMLAERGVDVSNEAVRRWFLKFRCLEPSPIPAATESALASGRKIRGRRHWLWRAVDDEVLDSPGAAPSRPGDY